MVVPPVFSVSKVTNAVASPVHKTWLEIALTCPLGFTVTSTSIEVPAHESI